MNFSRMRFTAVIIFVAIAFGLAPARNIGAAAGPVEERIGLGKGFKPISTKLENMKTLAVRAIKLNNELEKYNRIEVFSRSIEKQLGKDKDYLIGTLRTRIEKRGNWERGKISKDQYDAILCALTAMLYKKGLTEIVGDKANILDQIVLPDKNLLK